MLKSISIFCNLRQKFIIIFFFITQLIISLLELITLSLIPIFILYLTDPKKVYDKIDNINDFISENLFQIFFSIDHKSFRNHGCFTFNKKFFTNVFKFY